VRYFNIFHIDIGFTLAVSCFFFFRNGFGGILECIIDRRLLLVAKPISFILARSRGFSRLRIILNNYGEKSPKSTVTIDPINYLSLASPNRNYPWMLID